MQKKLVVLLSLVCACSTAWGADPDFEQLREKAEAGDAEAWQITSLFPADACARLENVLSQDVM